MGLDGVEAFVIKHRLYKAAGRRITVQGGAYIGSESSVEYRCVLKCFFIGLTNQVSRDVGMREPLAYPMRDRSFQRVAMKDILVDKGGELRLAARHVLSFAADARPDWIDLIKAP